MKVSLNKSIITTHLQFYRLNLVFFLLVNIGCLALVGLPIIALVAFKIFGNACCLILSKLFTSKYSYYFYNLGLSVKRIYITITVAEIVVLAVLRSLIKLIL
ncbi:hypothetical protein [Desertivirga brevis]|uniref:hypothetical protein n=1 Tax=Desertivirga brevis TaxID=2810310 RepID=UPI001A95BE01|nr:hypothetical protein [Pedobacter sp. SYSU D00873]